MYINNTLRFVLHIFVLTNINVMGSLLEHSVVFLAISEKKEFREIVRRRQQSHSAYIERNITIIIK